MNENPIIASIIGIFGKAKNFIGQAEVKVRNPKNGKMLENPKFADAVFQSMLTGAGWYTSAAWCAYFVKVWLMAFYSFDAVWINKNLGGSAVGNLIAIEKLNKNGFKTWVATRENKPEIGDVITWQQISNPSLGHTGIITDIGSSTYTTIEGNTAAQKDSREGDQVAQKVRTLDKLKIGSTIGGLKLIGFYRRVFTPQELAKLYFDENEKTLKFKA